MTNCSRRCITWLSIGMRDDGWCKARQGSARRQKRRCKSAALNLRIMSHDVVGQLQSSTIQQLFVGWLSFMDRDSGSKLRSYQIYERAYIGKRRGVFQIIFQIADILSVSISFISVDYVKHPMRAKSRHMLRICMLASWLRGGHQEASPGSDCGLSQDPELLGLLRSRQITAGQR